MAITNAARISRAATLTDARRERLNHALHDELTEHRAMLREINRDDAANDERNADLRTQQIALAERYQHAIEELKAAIARLRDGTYGSCEECGDAVAISRLDALPATRHCISCATTRSRA